MLYVHFVSPYFDHDAFMHDTMHILDTPDYMETTFDIFILSTAFYS